MKTDTRRLHGIRGILCVTFLPTPPPDRPLWTNLFFFHHLFPPTFCADHFSPSERNWKKIENILFSIIESWSERCCCRHHLVWLGCERENFSYHFSTSENLGLSLHPEKFQFLQIFEGLARPKKYFFFLKKQKCLRIAQYGEKNWWKVFFYFDPIYTQVNTDSRRLHGIRGIFVSRFWVPPLQIGPYEQI